MRKAIGGALLLGLFFCEGCLYRHQKFNYRPVGDKSLVPHVTAYASLGSMEEDRKPLFKSLLFPADVKDLPKFGFFLTLVDERVGYEAFKINAVSICDRLQTWKISLSQSPYPARKTKDGWYPFIEEGRFFKKSRAYGWAEVVSGAEVDESGGFKLPENVEDLIVHLDCTLRKGDQTTAIKRKLTLQLDRRTDYLPFPIALAIAMMLV
jgi:hypothetical protein